MSQGEFILFMVTILVAMLVMVLCGWMLHAQFIEFMEKRQSKMLQRYSSAIVHIDDAYDATRRDMNDAAGQSWRNIGS